MFATDDKAALHQVWDNDDALCTAHHFIWNAFVWRLHDGVKHPSR